MSTNPQILLLDIPIGGNGGGVWNRLHSEREDICEAMLEDCRKVTGTNDEVERVGDGAAKNWHQEMLQARLRKIDNALDRLMSGSYGNCSKCGKWIEDTKLEFDPAIEFCLGCWERESQQYRRPILSQGAGEANPGSVLSPVEVTLETLQPFDTILVRTVNSDYRILLLDPKTGRALLEGGQYLTEPREGVVTGSQLHGSLFKPGSIAVRYHMEMWLDEKILSTSPVQSISVEHRDGAESIDAITSAIH